jgi:acyl-CoA thioester hydrolase
MIFKREIRMGDRITIDAQLTKAASDYSRWSLSNTFYNEEGTVVAVSAVDGAWIDIEKRKLVVPDLFIQEAFASIPRSAEFESVIRKSA